VIKRSVENNHLSIPIPQRRTRKTYFSICPSEKFYVELIFVTMSIGRREPDVQKKTDVRKISIHKFRKNAKKEVCWR
jgi:hypothetical protein